MMPRFVIDDAEKLSVKLQLGVASPTFGVGLATFKRGRLSEPRVFPSPCTEKCCTRSKENSASLPAEWCNCDCVPGDEFVFDRMPEDEFDDFDLGPPPPCGPKLVRQSAIDLTAATESKSPSDRSMEAHAAARLNLMPTRNSSSFMAPTIFIRQSLRREV